MGGDLERRVRRMHTEMDRLLMELWGGPRSPRGSAARAPADVYVTDDPPTLTVELAVPGADPAGIRVELEGDVLTVRGVLTRAPRERRSYHHAEIDWGPFERRLRLNVPVDAEGVTAVYERGVLSIDLPLAESILPRRVEIAVRGWTGG
ncbi:MAG: Hsp20/alpha crystallin family protein [Actinomycetota bacterium]